MLPPATLTTSRLLLSLFEEEDANDGFVYASNANVARTTSWEPHRSQADSLAFIRLARNVENGRIWAVRFGTDRRAVGSLTQPDEVVRPMRFETERQSRRPPVIDDNNPWRDASLGEKIFLPFFTTKPDGSGIGLWRAG